MSPKDNELKRVTIAIDKDLDYKFRKLASQKFNFKTKWYSKAIEEAIELWLEKNPEK